MRRPNDLMLSGRSNSRFKIRSTRYAQKSDVGDDETFIQSGFNNPQFFMNRGGRP
jgi:hypothetical protein